MTQTYFAILVTTHVSPVPEGLEEPSGVFESLTDAKQAIRESNEEWAAQGGWPFGGCIRINEYSTREQAEAADVADGFRRGDVVSGTKPLSYTSL